MSSTKIDYSASSLNMSQASLISTNQNDQDVGVAIVSFMGHWAVYIIIFGLTLIIIGLIMKSLKDSEDEVTTEQATASETNRLLPRDVNYLEYGTCQEEEDLEARKWSSSSSSEDLYDGKICVICYEGQRNYFFVPCGHCVTCYACAERIMEGESKTCPICRRLVHKVRKLFDL